MEKMMWAKPEMNDIAYGASEYVAACGDSGAKYTFECDAGEGPLYYYTNAQVQKDDKASDFTWSTRTDKDYLGSVGPCPKYHESDVTADYHWGFLDFNGNGSHDSSTDDGGTDETVIVLLDKGWLPFVGEYISNWHATSNLQMSNWTINYSV